MSDTQSSNSTNSSSNSSASSASPKSSSSLSNDVNDIYSGASDFGRFWAIFGAIIATIVGIMFAMFGIYVLVKKSNLKQADGIVVSSDPPSCGVGQGNPPVYSCNITVSYTVNNMKFQEIIWYSGSKLYSNGQSISVYYEPSNPKQASLTGPVPHYVGVILIIVGILVVVFSWFIVWITRRYKFASAMVGVGGGISLMKDIM